MWWGIYKSLCYKFPSESNSEIILKIGKYLVKLWARVRCLVFFDSQRRSTFLRLNVCEKLTSFCQVLKKMHTKENWFLFSASHCTIKSFSALTLFVGHQEDHPERQRDKQRDRQTKRQAEGQTDRQTDRQMDGRPRVSVM